MVELFAYDVVEALPQSGCALCRALDQAENWEMATFVREAYRDADVRSRFFLSRGFCRHHAWLLQRLAAERENIAPVARTYADLIERDIEAVATLEAALAKGGSSRRRARLRRAATCPACQSAEATLQRKVSFFVDALASEAVRARFRASDGLCGPHLDLSVEVALVEDPDVALTLLEDWRLRLECLACNLAEYDRKRDHRYAHEPKGAEQDAWIDAIRRYVGEGPIADRVR